jgi:putative ABC transport system permease protein
MSGNIGVARNEKGDLLVSREFMMPVEFAGTQETAAMTLALRGMDEFGPTIRDGSITISAGRKFATGSREIVVGARLAGNFPDFGIGDTVRLGTVDWKVVGHFKAGGSAFESEIWSDLDSVRATFNRLGQVQSLRLRLVNASSISALQGKLQEISSTPLVAVTEANLYAAQSGRTANLIRLFGWPLAILMAVGATAGALNTMMSSVSDRTVEIATVRALGFSRLSTFLATWFEAVMLAAVGTIIGLVASWLIFNGWQASTVGSNEAQLGFKLLADGNVMLFASILGLAIGMFGGALPAIAATRLPVVVALRARG